MYLLWNLKWWHFQTGSQIILLLLSSRIQLYAGLRPFNNIELDRTDFVYAFTNLSFMGLPCVQITKYSFLGMLNTVLSLNVQKGTFWHVRPTSTQTSLRVHAVWSVFIVRFIKLHHVLSKIRPVKIQIRLRECAGWFESSLGAHWVPEGPFSGVDWKFPGQCRNVTVEEPCSKQGFTFITTDQKTLTSIFLYLPDCTDGSTSASTFRSKEEWIHCQGRQFFQTYFDCGNPLLPKEESSFFRLDTFSEGTSFAGKQTGLLKLSFFLQLVENLPSV